MARPTNKGHARGVNAGHFTKNELEHVIILKSFNILKSFCYFNTSYQEEATHKNGSKRAKTKQRNSIKAQ
jgi:hypothetical protein